MIAKIIEATQGDNWGKFLLGRFDESEWARKSEVASGQRLLGGQCAWDRHHVLVLDLQTGEGAIFRPKGCVKADLDKHAVWVCPLYEPFLNWLYEQDLTDIMTLPNLVTFKKEDAPFAMYGYRRPGKGRKEA